MPMGKKEARILAHKAREALRAAKMENASFASPEEMERFKKLSRLYRQSWIEAPLIELIEALEAHS